jgi:hypothetical protein
MKFEFAEYTEVTDLALELRPEYKKEGIKRLFICPDVTDYWFVRIVENTNEKQEVEEGCFLLERNKIEKEYKGEELTISKLKEIIENVNIANKTIAPIIINIFLFFE